MSVIEVLRERQISLTHVDNRRQAHLFKSMLTPRCVFLGKILDENQQLLEGHIILGYSINGLYLISYQLQIDGRFISDTMMNYSLHWWKFELDQPLKLIQSSKLFEGCTIQGNVSLSLCQREDKAETFVILANKINPPEEYSTTCYVSVLSFPSDGVSIHLTYEGSYPKPRFNPFISLQLSNAVILNTGYSLNIVQYDNVSLILSESSTKYCKTLIQQFLPEDASTLSHDNTFHSPGQILPVEVYQDCTALIECSSSCLNESSDIKRICQYCLDIEQWLSIVLVSVLKGHQLTLCSITDYDLDILDVSESDWLIALVVVVNAETMSTDSKYSGHQLELIGSWSVLDNTVQLISHSDPVPMTLHQLFSNNHLTNGSKQDRPLNDHLHSLVYVSTNRNVVALSKSRPALHHPFLPLSLILSKPN